MPVLNWGLIQDGGVLESLMHAILYAEDPQTILFGRPGKDAGQDARTSDGTVVYQSKYRNGLDMDGAVALALEELKKIKKYRDPNHENHKHWKNATSWVLFANLSINPNDDAKWKSMVVPEFVHVGLAAEYWTTANIEGKLAEKTEIREVFFGQENRVLVGLKEAHDLLRNERIGGASLDIPIIGRDAELQSVIEFSTSREKRVLPVIGPGGIGKSRLMYDSLVALSRQGWRVFWGLPETMAKSSQWFRLVNGNQKTCVVLDDPDDPNLLRAVIEQLSTVERRNWRVIVSYRTDRSDTLQKYKTNKIVQNAIRLSNLNEPNSKELLNKCLSATGDNAWLHKVFQFTRGNPGWLCLIAALVNQKKLHELPRNSDDIASMYVQSCLAKFDGATADQANNLLRWLSLWGAVVLEKGSADREDIAFLEKVGIPKTALRDLLKKLVETGLVRNWGVGKRLFGVESLIIRQHILTEWLLDELETGTYSVSSEGADIVKRLVAGELPRLDATLLTISQLSLSRLDSDEADTLLRPIFNEMVEATKPASLIQQNYLAELVEKLGAADPESALGVLIAVRANLKEQEEIEDPFWGKRTFTQDRLLTTLSWTLFNIAESVDDIDVARKFLLEFRELFKFVESGLNPDEPGKSPRQLVERLLCESTRSGLFAKPAYDLATEHILSQEWWPFVGVLAKCILEPKRETREWIANWTLGISRYAIATDSPDWERLVSLRGKLFESLQSEEHRALYDHIWPLLSDSHHSLGYANAHYRMRDVDHLAYRSVLINDLTRCQSLLTPPRTFGEATLARPIWKWYLEYGQDEALVAPAHECERRYSALSRWRIHDFFRFEYDERLAVETERIAKSLRDATAPNVFVDFFDEVSRYLSSARGKSDDMADGMQLGALADKLADKFHLGTLGSKTALSSFVLSALAAGEKSEPRSFSFAIMVCRARLRQLKAAGKVNPRDWLNRLLSTTPSKGAVLYRLYSNAHPHLTGALSAHEVQCILSYKNDFIDRQWFWLLGILVAAHDESLSAQVIGPLESLQGKYEASICLGDFIRASYITFLRYERKPSQELVKSIVEWIIQYGLDGALLESHDLETLVKNSGFVPTMRLFAALMQSRVELEGTPKPDERFRILPYHFNIQAWCRFQSTNADDVAALHDVCRLTFEQSFTASYWIPKYLPAIDPSGDCVAGFVTQQLADNNEADVELLSKLSYLASEYPLDSEAWARIASPICETARGLGREDREHLYFCLSRKETGVMTSMPGEVPEYYVHVRDSAKRLLDREPQYSPLRSYRAWALKTAEYDLRREEGRAEEDADE